MPIDLMARSRTAAWMLGQGQRSPIPECRELEDVEQWALNEWQKRWTVSTKGRHTHLLWPDIRKRLASKYVHVDHYMAQFATSHGDFAAKLHFFRCKPWEGCSGCREVETAEHVFFSCPQYENQEDHLRQTATHGSTQSALGLTSAPRRSLYAT